jgi:hypothetical protein
MEDKLMERITRYVIAFFVFAAGLSAPLPAQQAGATKSDLMEPESMQALNQTGKYLRSLKDFQVQAEVTSELVLADGQKLQNGHTANLLARMPDKLRVDINGYQRSRLLLYDGKLFTLFARLAVYYATVAAPPTIGQFIDVDVDVHRHGGYYGGGCCYHSGVGVAAAVATTAIVTAAIVGTTVYTLPPSCTVVIVNGITYQQCGSSWYQPQFVGGSTTYVVVNAPR